MNNELSPFVAGFPTTLKGPSLYTAAIDTMGEQRSALIEDNWELLEQLAYKGIGQCYANQTEIRQKMGVTAANSAAVTSTFKDMLIAQAQDPQTRQAFFSALKDSLLQLNPNSDQELLDGLDELANGQIDNNPVIDMVTNMLNQSDPEERYKSAIEGTAALAARSIIALAHVNFRKQSQTIDTVDFSTFPADFDTNLKEEVELIEEALLYAVTNIYSGIQAGDNLELICNEAIQVVESNIGILARIQASIRRYALSLKEAGKGGKSEKVGNLAAKAGDLTREAYAIYAAAYYMLLEENNPHRSTKFDDLISSANTIQLNKTLPNGKNTDIPKVGDADDGDFIETAGFVTNIEAFRSNDNKLISRVTLHDPSSNTSVELIGIFTHLRHMGLQEDSYCRLSGIYHSASPLNSGNPAIQISKLSINDLSKTIWRVAFLDFADKFVDRWPNGYNIQYGLAPHISDANAATESKIQGAGELIFKPFIQKN